MAAIEAGFVVRYYGKAEKSRELDGVHEAVDSLKTYQALLAEAFHLNAPVMDSHYRQAKSSAEHCDYPQRAIKLINFIRTFYLGSMSHNEKPDNFERQNLEAAEELNNDYLNKRNFFVGVSPMVIPILEAIAVGIRYELEKDGKKASWEDFQKTIAKEFHFDSNQQFGLDSYQQFRLFVNNASSGQVMARFIRQH